MTRAVLVALLIAAVACRSSAPEHPAADATSRRRLPTGDVVGAVGRYGGHVWRGLPYAMPPTGERRWRAPEPPPAWSGTREALEPGPACVQYAGRFGGVTERPEGTPAGSEDCLVLDVFAPRMTPEAAAAAHLPVMVWIHGGGNSIGRGSFYEGGRLAISQQVVVVTVNYRLGPFGFFRHAALREGATAVERSGNFALLDLVRALEWVHEAAPAFGGDPGNVTIFGESAGGANVLALVLAPPARGLFHRAIAHSAGMWTSAPADGEGTDDPGASGVDANRSGEVALRLLADPAADRDTARSRLAAEPAAKVAQRLRALPADAVLRAYPPKPGGMIDFPRMFRDGVVLPGAIWADAFATSGTAAPVPIVLGTNRDETKLFLGSDPQWVRRLFWLVPQLRDPDAYDVTNEHLSRMWKAVAADQPATALRQAGHRDVWVYRFDWDEEARPLGADLPRIFGAAHAFEIPFVFGHFDLGREGNLMYDAGNAPGREALSQRMMSYWGAIAHGGAPGRGRDGGGPEWTRWGDGGARMLVLDTPDGGGVRMSAEETSRSAVLDAVERDPRLPTARERCGVYRALARMRLGLTLVDYPRAGRDGCAAFPFDA